MKVPTLKLVTILLTVLLVIFISQIQPFDDQSSFREEQDEMALTSIGNVQTVLTAYKRWKNTITQNGANRILTLSLNYSKGLSANFTKAQGQARLNLLDGSLSVEVSGLPDHEEYRVWLIDNRSGPGQSVKPDVGDRRIHVGTLDWKKKLASLRTHLNVEALKGFELDLIVITRIDEQDRETDLLFGTPNLFQRLYYDEQRGQLATLTRADLPSNSNSSNGTFLSHSFHFLVPSPAYAREGKKGKRGKGSSPLKKLISRGENLFFNETFKGNGRTCGTCHPAENNFTIDPPFIATLPAKDPLFVAEFNEDLATLERPKLMRQFGLILENIDGFDDLENKFTMRGVPHTLALPLSLTAPGGDGTTTPPIQRTGWSGDGAPNDGSLRQFAVGAVTQHFPKSLQRRVNKDFRLPTEHELDALEAFQLSLGRREELDLDNFRPKDPDASIGKDLFLNEGKCNRCHRNAGANVMTTSDPPLLVNNNFDTGVENLPDHPARSVLDFPCDGGFGKEPEFSTCGPNGNQIGFGDGQFNTPTLVEAADTGPFFHNNAVDTIEESVNFYTLPAFNNTTIGRAFGGIVLNPVQVAQIGKFLRVINALENERSARAFSKRVLRAFSRSGSPPFGKPHGRKHQLIRLVIADIDDAIKVLGDVNLHPEAISEFKQAKQLLQKNNAPSPKKRSKTKPRKRSKATIKEAINHLKAARVHMIE